MRLIDADAIIKRIPYEEIVSRYAIVNAPTIDAVEVVRCKDCKHCQKEIVLGYKLDWDYCDLWNVEAKADGYCWKAERRSDE